MKKMKDIHYCKRRRDGIVNYSRQERSRTIASPCECNMCTCSTGIYMYSMHIK